MRIIWVVLLVGLLGACANPLNRVTSDRYGDECSAAEQSGNLGVAEQFCYRALVNVDWGNLGPELKSQRLYNLGRIKRKLAKHDQAEDLLKQALSIEENLSGPTDIKIGRRLAELSLSLAQQEKWEEGMVIVERLLGIDASYAPGEQRFLGALFDLYARQARASNRSDLAAALDARAKALEAGD